MILVRTDHPCLMVGRHMVALCLLILLLLCHWLGMDYKSTNLYGGRKSNF
jgi:hypothetical protein